MRRSTPLLLLLLACSLGASAGAEGSGRRGRRLYSIPEEHLADVEDDPSQKWAPLWVMGFLVISSGLLIYIVKAGLTSSAKEDED